MRRTAIVLAQPTQSLEGLVDRARAYAVDSRAEATRRAYAADFAAFEAWSAQQEARVHDSPTPAKVAFYLTALADAGRRPSSIERALTGIAHGLRERGEPWQKAHPAIVAIMSGIRNQRRAPPAQKSALLDEELGALLRTLGTDLPDLRDRALLTIGFWGAYRRSELVSLQVEDITHVPREGLLATLRRSKTDQAGEGFSKGIPYTKDPAFCPVRALDAWLAAANITEGPIFHAIDQHGHVSPRALCDRSVALIVKRTAVRAGIEPAHLAGHSLRAGFATTAALADRGLDAIMRQTGHTCERVARGYIRNANVFKGNAAAGLR